MRAEKSLLLPFLLSKIGLTFLCQFCPSRTQSIATVPANVYNCPCKALRPLPQTSVSFASNACSLCLKRLREKAPSLRIPFLPCSPHRAEGRRYHNSRPRGGRAERFCPKVIPACPTSVFPTRTRNKLLQKKRLAQMASFLSENE